MLGLVAYSDSEGEEETPSNTCAASATRAPPCHPPRSQYHALCAAQGCRSADRSTEATEEANQLGASAPAERPGAFIKREGAARPFHLRPTPWMEPNPPVRNVSQLPSNFFDAPAEADAGEADDADVAPQKGWAGLSALLPPPTARPKPSRAPVGRVSMGPLAATLQAIHCIVELPKGRSCEPAASASKPPRHPHTRPE